MRAVVTPSTPTFEELHRQRERLRAGVTVQLLETGVLHTMRRPRQRPMT